MTPCDTEGYARQAWAERTDLVPFFEILGWGRPDKVKSSTHFLGVKGELWKRDEYLPSLHRVKDRLLLRLRKKGESL